MPNAKISDEHIALLADWLDGWSDLASRLHNLWFDECRRIADDLILDPCLLRARNLILWYSVRMRSEPELCGTILR